MEKYEIVKNTENFEKRISDIREVIDFENLLVKIDEKEKIMTGASFWDDINFATKFVQDNNDLKEKCNDYKELVKKLDDLKTIIELNDELLFEEAEELINDLSKSLEEVEIKLLLDEEYDHCHAIIEIHPGAGGTESQDWALMLYRMFKRYCEKNKLDFELLDCLEAIDAGIKSVSFTIKNKNAYGMLKGEKGVHRLVRISPFDSNARRHTSFAAVNVTPEIEDNINVSINQEDIKIDTYRSSGAGGQHVNTTDSAVRITHLPTGIVVSCQNERSQIQNRERAMQVLKSKIYQKIQEEQDQLKKNIGSPLTDNGFGSQIRSYVLHPYSMVKDHRTSIESSNPASVLDGNIEMFLNGYLKWYKSKK